MGVETDNLGGYRESSQNNTFSYDTGVVVLPVASRTAGHRLIRLHGGIGFRRAQWKLERGGKPPIIPAFANTSGDTILSGTVSPALPQPSTTSSDSYDWSVSGEYVYVQNAPRVAGTDPFPVGQHPFVVAGAASAAQDMVSASLVQQAYSGNTPFATLSAALQESVLVEPTGDYKWPFLVLPAMFSTTTSLQD